MAQNGVIDSFVRFLVMECLKAFQGGYGTRWKEIIVRRPIGIEYARTRWVEGAEVRAGRVPFKVGKW